jgi:signal transduction histidine kinase/HAMP domain-containing protein
MIERIKAFYLNSIKRRLIITITVNYIILMSFFVYDLLSEQRKFLETQNIKQVKSLTKSVAQNSVLWLLSNDYIGLEELISSISKYPNLEYAMILNKEGKIIAHSDKEYLNLYISDELSLAFLLSKKIEPYMLVQNNEIIDYIMPILRDNQHIGWVRIALNQNEISKNLQQIFYEAILFILIAIVIGYLFSYFLATNITKDLYTLIKVATQTATGNRNQRADIQRKDELGILSNEINKMLDKIEENEKQLEISNKELEKDIVKLELMDSKLTQLNRDLEKKVEEKTYELKKLNDNLEKEIKEEVEQNRQKDNMLFQQSKMASMGEMIENIAHQWRQPLSLISTSASGIRLNKEYNTLTDELLNEAVENIMNSTNFLSNTIDDFRDFYKVDKIKEKFNIKDVLDKTLKLTSSRFTNRAIKVIKECEDVEILGFENELVQVFINLLNNARDVLEELPYEERYIFVTIKKIENEAYISLKDNANGIEESILEKIFDPYFTTKGSDKGTGIGLFMSKEIIEKHFHGKIIAQNETFTYNKKEYKGANFIITIPF